jgi:Ribonuclease G/E
MSSPLPVILYNQSLDVTEEKELLATQAKKLDRETINQKAQKALSQD